MQGVKWLRWFALCRRRSFKIFLAPLPNRFVETPEEGGGGQGGGGALSVHELCDVLEATSSDPALSARSCLHTDKAKAYNRLGPLRWPMPGALFTTLTS